MAASNTATIYDYFRLLRVDHWFKNIFVLPGLCLAYTFSGAIPNDIIGNILFGFMSVCILASANYVINEWLDRNFDQFHPIKKHRASVQKNLKAEEVYFEYSALALLGLTLAWQVNHLFFVSGFSLLVMGFLYNVQPIRLKDRIYFDVMSESINNPIRFMLGWAMVAPFILPPVSALFAYWMGGAFLMGVKRYAEYRMFKSPETAAKYRASFAEYNEGNLLISSFFYALSSALFLGVFLIKYRIEYIVLFPFLAVLFAWYLKIGLSVDSTAQHPEKLYREKGFVLYVLFLFIIAFLVTFIEIDWLHLLLEQTFIDWDW